MHFHRALRRDSAQIITPFVRVRTSLCFYDALEGILYVAAEIGLYLHPSLDGAWRVVSEDSLNYLESFLLIVSVV